MVEPDTASALGIFLPVFHAGAIHVYGDFSASWCQFPVFIPSCHMGGIAIWVHEDLEAFH